MIYIIQRIITENKSCFAVEMNFDSDFTRLCVFIQKKNAEILKIPVTVKKIMCKRPR